jgi:hypothetical protein
MSIPNLTNYSFTNSDLVELSYTDIQLTFLLTRLTTDNTKQITSYIDENNVAIIRLTNSDEYWFIDLSYPFNQTMFSLLRNVRLDLAYLFGIRFDVYDDRDPANIVSLLNQNIDQLCEYIQYPVETPIQRMRDIYSMRLRFDPVLPKVNQPTFEDAVSIDGSAPALKFVDGANTDWSLKLDGSNNLGFYRGGTESVLSLNRDTGSMTLAKGLTINNPSPALILTGTIGSNTVSGGMQANIANEVAVASFSNHNLSFFLNGSNANMYKICSMKTDKSMFVNGTLNVVNMNNGAPVATFDGLTNNTTVWGEFYKKNPSRISCSCNTFTFNIPSNIPTVIPFNQLLSQQGLKILLNTTTGLFTLSQVGMYHIYFVWAPHEIVNTRLAASYVIRNPIGGGELSTGPTVLSNNGDSVSISTTIYISTANSTIEFRALHYSGTDLRLATSTSNGAYWTYAAVMFLY